MEKSVVLLSAGLDSTVNLYEAHRATQVVLALTFDYGQRAASSEITSAQALTNRLNIPHRVVELPFFKDWGTSSLIDGKRDVPRGKDVQIDHLQTSQTTARSVWVPNRNGVFLNIAAGFAEALGASLVVPGFNLEEAQTFPDNSSEFLKKTTEALALSTSNHTRAHCYTTQMNKTEIVQRGKALGVEFSMIWPCYFAGVTWCGECESCQRSRRAFLQSGVMDDELRFGEADA